MNVQALLRTDEVMESNQILQRKTATAAMLQILVFELACY